MISQDNIKELFERATAAKVNAYVPYSHYKVGAAILSGSGRFYCGCNFENASFGATICAERNAVGAFVQAGEKKLLAIGIVAEGSILPYPCGICRQVLSEWGGDSRVYVFDEQGTYREHTLAELLPFAFSLEEQ